MLLKSTLDARAVFEVVSAITWAHYEGNITVSAEDVGTTRDGRNKVRFTLAAESSFGRGARSAAPSMGRPGRKLPKASWQAHREVMQWLFEHDPAAHLKTAFADYRGGTDFKARFESTGDRNCGSQMEPCRIRDTETLPGLWVKP